MPHFACPMLPIVHAHSSTVLCLMGMLCAGVVGAQLAWLAWLFCAFFM